MLKQNMKQGILLIAHGNPYYGRMALNLAKTIKSRQADAHITIYYSGAALNHVNERSLNVFDEVINMCPSGIECSPFKYKLLLPELTPYERTLYIDVDTIWVNKFGPDELFNIIPDSVELTGITEGYYNLDDPNKSDVGNYNFWADKTEIAKVYPQLTGRLYQWRTEFIYFKKTEAVQAMFELARGIYDDRKIKSATMFAGHIPDELAFNIAACACGMHPHIYKWRPSFWERLNNYNIPGPEQLMQEYYIMSCGSNFNSPGMRKVYDRMVKKASSDLGMQHVFPLVSKIEMMPDRQKM